MYHIIIVDSVLAKYFFVLFLFIFFLFFFIFFLFLIIDAHPKVRTLLGHIRYINLFSIDKFNKKIFFITVSVLCCIILWEKMRYLSLGLLIFKLFTPLSTTDGRTSVNGPLSMC